MTNFRDALSNYLTMRRGLGFKLASDERGLISFVSFVELNGPPEYITVQIAADWCLRGSSQQITKVTRLRYVRGFTQYLKLIDSRTEIPSQDLIKCKAKRARPYLYTDREIERLMKAASGLDTVDGLRHLTYHYLLGLLSVTGMRISEAISLNVGDVDFKASILTVRGTKFGKSRLIPLHDTTCEALRKYKVSRDQIGNDDSESAAFFISSRRTRLNYRVVLKTFDMLCQQIGIRGRGKVHVPRIHDLRHRMAVNTLLRWYRNGDDPERRLPALATYLGHVHVADTYWYLTACPELMQEAVKRLEQRGR